jgi:hypothetical protein
LGAAALVIFPVRPVFASGKVNYYQRGQQASTAVVHRKGLVDSLIIAQPKFGHLPVREVTVNIVKSAIQQLKPSAYYLLNEGGATITVAPNTIDRWPEGGEIVLECENRVLGEVPGHTLHRDNQGPDIAIYERPIVRGTRKLKEPFSDSEILRISFHEFGHGVDDLKRLSTDPQFLLVHSRDLQDLSQEDKAKYFWFLKPMEACAEITGSLICNCANNPMTVGLNNAFPRTTRWLREKLRL